MAKLSCIRFYLICARSKLQYEAKIQDLNYVYRCFAGLRFEKKEIIEKKKKKKKKICQVTRAKKKKKYNFIVVGSRKLISTGSYLPLCSAIVQYTHSHARTQSHDNLFCSF